MASRQTAQKLETCQLASAAIKSHEERVWSNKIGMFVYDFSKFVKSLNYLMMPVEIYPGPRGFLLYYLFYLEICDAKR